MLSIITRRVINPSCTRRCFSMIPDIPNNISAFFTTPHEKLEAVHDELTTFSNASCIDAYLSQYDFTPYKREEMKKEIENQHTNKITLYTVGTAITIPSTLLYLSSSEVEVVGVVAISAASALLGYTTSYDVSPVADKYFADKIPENRQNGKDNFLDVVKYQESTKAFLPELEVLMQIRKNNEDLIDVIDNDAQHRIDIKTMAEYQEKVHQKEINALKKEVSRKTSSGGLGDMYAIFSIFNRR